MNTATPHATRRDRWGRYLVLPPEGGKPVGYTRATTIAKTIDDTSSLMAWGERMTAIGLARRPDLYALIDDIADDKTELNRLCDKAKEAGGATVRRDLGTHLHSILERSFTDADYQPPAAHADDVAAVHATLAAHGYTVIPDMCERIVVDDTNRIAGTFDLMLRDTAGRNIIADIKTGSTVKYSGVSFATQLAIYANADALYTQGAAKDGSDDLREPMPQVAHDHAIIIHVQPGSGQCDLYELQLDVGLLSLAMAVREARKSKLLRPIDTTPADNPRDAWVRERVNTLINIDKMRVAECWPSDVLPPKRQPVPYTNPQIDQIADMCNRLEAEWELPFGDPDPANTSTPRSPQTRPQAPTTPEMPDEGAMAPDLLHDLKHALQNELDDRQRNRVRQWMNQADRAGIPIRAGQEPTMRRIHINHTMLAACLNQMTDEHLRDLALYTLDDDTAEVLDIGTILALHTADQAGALRSLTEMGATITQQGDGTHRNKEPQNNG